MRWILIVLLMCNGVYFLWQNYLLQNEPQAVNVSTYTQYSPEQKLLLLTELKSPLVVADTAKSEKVTIEEIENAVIEEAAPLVPVEELPAMCWLIGPFKEQVSGKQVVSRLEALGISLSLQTLEIPGAPDYWVHLPPQISRKVAVKLLRELQAKKIDSFLITEGELANGISLGFFTQEARATKVHQQRIKQGYDARIKIVPRARTEMWAVFAAGEYDKLSDALWGKIQQGNKGLERRKNYCDKIASQDNFD